MASAARAWNDALQAARACMSELDATEAIGMVDEDGDGTWELVEILLSKLRGQSIPLLDRNTVADGWRRVLLFVEEGASEGKLHFCNGEVVNEEDTPDGTLSILEGIHSLRMEYGLFYAVPPEVCAAAAKQDSDVDLEESEDSEPDDDKAVELPDAAAHDVDTEVQIKDKMRIMFNETPMTLRTREGTGDTGIAGTKVRLLSMDPGSFLMVLRSDIEAGIKSGEVQVLSEVDDPEGQECEHPMDVLRSDKAVTGTLYSELAWPFAGATPAPCPAVCRARARAVCS
jgi:hypothetical protein